MSGNTIRVGDIAHGRSGDKGNHANIGIIAYTQEGFDYLCEALQTEVVQRHFDRLSPSRIERFKMPGIMALNFLLFDVLDGGGSRSLRIDSQGKTLAMSLLEARIAAPDKIDAMRDPSAVGRPLISRPSS